MATPSLDHVFLIGISHKTAPVEEREKFSFTPETLPALYDAVLGGCTTGVEECIALSTCNRTELYAVLGDPQDAARDAIRRYITKTAGAGDAFLSRFYEKSGIDAIEHLFAVTTGIDSLILGEPQIFGQVKSAYATACDRHATGPLTNRLFHRAFQVGKQIRSETAIGEGTLSIGSAAVELVRRRVGDLAASTVLLIGAGKIGELCARQLKDAGIGRLVIANRTLSRAQELACRLSGDALSMTAVGDIADSIDVIITSVASAAPVVTVDRIQRSCASRNGRPLVIVDLGVPRNVAPGVAELPGVHVFDIDDLSEVTTDARGRRQGEAEKAWAIIHREVAAYCAWIGEREAVPAIQTLRDRCERIRLGELERIKSRVSPETYDALDLVSRRIVRKLLHQPTIAVRSASDDDRQRLIHSLRDLFSPDDGENSQVTDPMTEERMPDTITLGTRGSLLARTQTDMVSGLLKERHPGIAVEIVIITTEGDQDPTRPLDEFGGRGAFVQALERALLEGRIDAAVHSLKDLPSTLPEGLMLGAVPERVDPRDVLVSRSGAHLENLPAGAIIGTGSKRRIHQLAAHRSDLVFAPIRGNIDTRLAKLFHGDYDAVVFGAAALIRLGQSALVTDWLDTGVSLPAPCQGAVGVECRADDPRVVELLRAIDNPRERLCAEAERAFIAVLGMGCHAPVGALARHTAEGAEFTAFAAYNDTESIGDRILVPTDTLIAAAGDMGARFRRHIDLATGGH